MALGFWLAAAWVGNYFSLPLFFGVDFLFGSIAVLIVVRLYGTVWATLTGAIASSYTYILWQHPYAIVIFTCEALFVGLLLNPRGQNLEMATISVWLILLKQPVNGIFNALIASLLYTHLPIHKWAGGPQVSKSLSLQQTLTNLLVAFIFFPVLMLMVLDGRSVVKDIETTIQTDLTTLSQAVGSQVLLWHQPHRQALAELFRLASDYRPSATLQQSTELLYRSALPDFRRLYVTNADGRTRASYPPLEPLDLPRDGGRSCGKEVFLDKQEMLLVLKVPAVRDDRLLACVGGEIDLGRLSQLVESATKGYQMHITLVDGNKRVLASTEQIPLGTDNFDLRQLGKIRPLSPRIFQRLPEEPNLPKMVYWQKSFYVSQESLGSGLNWTLWVEAAAAPQINLLQKLYINHLALILIAGLLGVDISTVLSQWLVKPLLKLADVTSNLSRQIQAGIAIDLRPSLVAEIDSLASNFLLMADTISQQFRELRLEIHERQQVSDRLKASLQEKELLLKELEQFGELRLEIYKRRLVEDNLKASLQEKELLLKEIHHRVKNNLLVVANILEFQSDYTKDPETLKILSDSHNRIHSMALIHEKLYRSTALDKVNFGEYLKSLVENLCESYKVWDDRIQFELAIDPIMLNIETALWINCQGISVKYI